MAVAVLAVTAALLTGPVAPAPAATVAPPRPSDPPQLEVAPPSDVLFDLEDRSRSWRGRASGTDRALFVKAEWDGNFADGTTDAVLDEEMVAVDDWFGDVSRGAYGIDWTVRPGWLTIDAPSTSCDDDYGAFSFQVAAAVDEALLAQGVDMHAAYDLQLVYMPSTDCFYAGVSLGSETLYNGWLSLHLLTHEIGHSLGLGHAGTMTCTAGGVEVPDGGTCVGDTYGDTFDVMGSGWEGMYSSHRLLSLGWLAPGSQRTVPEPAPGRATSTTVDLGPFADTTSSLRSVRIPFEDGTALWVENRQSLGVDTVDVWSDEVAGVQVRLVPRATAPPIPGADGHTDSFLIDARAGDDCGWCAETLVPGQPLSLLDGTVTIEVASAVPAPLSRRVTITRTTPRAPWSPFTGWDDLVDQQYRDVLGRAPTASEHAAAVDALEDEATPGALVAGLRDRAAGIVDPTARLYWAYFLRAPDAGGLLYWVDARRRGMTLYRASAHFAGSREFRDRYGTLSDGGFVDLVYRNVLGRDADPGGRRFWVDQLASRRRTRGQVMVGFSESPEFRNLRADEVVALTLHILLLRTTPSPSERDALVTRLLDGDSAADLATSILESTAYADRFA